MAPSDLRGEPCKNETFWHYSDPWLIFDQQVPCVRGYFLAKAESGGKGGEHQAPRQHWRSRPQTVTRLEVPSKLATRRQEVMCNELTTRCARLAAACPMFRTHTPSPFRPINTAATPAGEGERMPDSFSSREL